MAYAIRDLLSVLHTQIKPIASDTNEIDRLIGAGVLAYFEDDSISANNLFGQVSILQPELTEKISPLSDWLKSRHKPETQQAALLSESIETIRIVEKARVSEHTLYDDRQSYEWSLEIDEAKAILEKVDFVRYLLHPTFPQPERIIRDRKSNFRLDSIGWGIFTVTIEVHFVDGSVARTNHDLTFDSAHEG